MWSDLMGKIVRRAHCSITTKKIVLYVINAILALSAIGLVVVAVYTESEVRSVISLVPHENHTSLEVPTYMEILVGVSVFTGTSLGCWGTIIENLCLLNSYGFILLSVVILQIIVAILCFYGASVVTEIMGSVYEQMDHAFRWYYEEEESRKYVEFLQEREKCCGLDGPLFWGGSIPGSCCGKIGGACTIEEAYVMSCLSAIHQNLEWWLIVLGVVATVSAVATACFVIFPFCLAQAISNEEEMEPEFVE